jgi:flavin-dependent dehydrogenase
MSVKHDFAVIGGGPAGCAMAILLARSGARVALLEKTDYHAFRIGEHLHPSVREALYALGCEREALAQCAVAARGIASRWKNGEALFRPYFRHRGPLGLNVVRNAFDALLFERAAASGATMYAGATHLDIEPANPGWRIAFEQAGVRQELDARVLIDASGRRSVVARRLGSRWLRSGNTKAIAMLLPCVAVERDDDNALRVESVASGWLSLTPRGEDMVLTLYTVARNGHAPSADARASMRDALSSSTLIRSRIASFISSMRYAGTWPGFPRLLAKPFGEGWFAIGEAAAAYDPISGHGVVFALETAFRASEMALSDSPLEVLGPLYRDAIAARYEDHLRRREEIYREAADQFPGSLFWSQFASA